MNNSKLFYFIFFIAVSLLIIGCKQEIKNIERPEKIVSKRQIVYDQQTYSKLADLWKNYNSEFPSEDSYANWMYAARYAQLADYESLLKKGLSKYPANPTLLYLTGIQKHGKKDNLESIHILEKAAKLDPSFLDPLFGLVVEYLAIGESEKSDAMLRSLLTQNAISDEVMDYNYNVISLLDKNAILITNGDNDTYPVWILTRIIKYRPDVKIVNRSLLNTDWYPEHLMNNEGIAKFISPTELTKLRESIFRDLKNEKVLVPVMGPFSDTLITKLIKTAKENKRPIYLAATLYNSSVIERNSKNGMNLGLVTRIETSTGNYSNQIKTLVNKWLNKFRTSGLASWKLRYEKVPSAGKNLVTNYGYALKSLMDQFILYTPDKRLELFLWYKKNIVDLLPVAKVDSLNKSWCKFIDIQEIDAWCKENNYIE